MRNSILIASLCFLSVPAFAATGKVVGQLGMVEGEVLVDSRPVQKNAPVREGSVVEVKSGRATLIIGKGSVFNLAADSKMVVNAYSEKTDQAPEAAELDLKFGRTRALILNQGSEKKDVKIKARAATMGVRGTEIYINAPKDSAQPIQFFTLEGKADVTAHPGAPIVPVAQNQGVTASGVAPTTSGNTNSGSGNPSSANGSGSAAAGSATTGTTVATNIAEVKAELKDAGLTPSVAAAQIRPDTVIKNPLTDPGPRLDPVRLDPVQDKPFSPLKIHPHFCNAGTAGTCL